jgi:nicotinate phosphoribosyltransferase
MVPIFEAGRLVYQNPSLHDIRKKTMKNLKALDAGYKRFHNPHTYHVSLSTNLFETKQRLLREAAKTQRTTAHP